MGNASNKRKNKKNKDNIFLEENQIKNSNKTEKKEKIIYKKQKDLLIIVPEKQKDYFFYNNNEIPYHDYLKSETKNLLVSKKKALETQFGMMRRNLNTLHDINDIFETKTKKDISINNKTVKYCNQCFLGFYFKIIGPIFVILNLVGIHQLIWLYKSTQKELSFGFKSLLLNNTRNITEYDNYVNYSFNNMPDFNLFYLTSIIGNFFLKLFGYKISSLFFSFINVIIFFFLKSYSFPNEYHFSEFVMISIYFTLLFISVGSITLIPHSIYFDGLRKYIQYSDDDEEEENNKSFFSYLSFTEIPAYLINIMINYYLKTKNYYNNLENYFISSILIYLSFVVLSILVYLIYSLAFDKNEKSSENKDISIIACRILGYLFYSEKKKQGIKIDLGNKKEDKNMNLENFKTQIKRRNNYSNVYLYSIRYNDLNNIQNYLDDIEEYLVYNEYEIIDNVNGNNKKSINDENDLNESNTNKSLINSNDSNNNNENGFCYEQCYECKLGLRKCYHKSKEADSFCLLFCCCECCKSCCGLDDRNLSELNQGDEQFCYIYKIQRKFSWFCDLLFKDNILDFLIEDIFLEIMTIGFSKELEKNFKQKDFNEKFITIILYLLFFLLLSLINSLISQMACVENFISNIKEKVFEKYDSVKYFEKQINNVVILVLIHLFINTIFSGFSLFGKQILKNITNKYLSIFPFALTKFYNFILMNCLVNIMDENNMDLLSSSVVASFFLMIYNLFSYFLTDLLDLSEKVLIFFQFIVGSIFCSLFLILVISVLVNVICCPDD